VSWLSQLAHKLPSPVDPLHIFGKHNPTDPLNIFGKTGIPNPADPFNTFAGGGHPAAPGAPGAPGTPAVPAVPGLPDATAALAPGGAIDAVGQAVPGLGSMVTRARELTGGQGTPPVTAPTATDAAGTPPAPGSAGTPEMSPQIQAFLNRLMHGGLSGFGAFGGQPFGGFGQFLMSNPALMQSLGLTPQGAVPGPLPGSAPVVDSVPAGELPPLAPSGDTNVPPTLRRG